MELIFISSIVAAFLAGMVALFAPCCITVLLPAYLASVFREKRSILKMTLVFFAGISLVLVPIGLGAAWLAEIFRDYHKEMYVVGGVIMLFLAVLSVLGKGLSLLPVKKLNKYGARSNFGSVFFLGVFSGAATSCCAPVLAGVMTLAVLSGGFWKSIIVSLSYVLGIVFPLVLAAYYYDRFHIEESQIIKGKMLELNLGGRMFFIHSTNLLAGIIFLIVGVTLLILAFSGDAFWAPHWQSQFGEALNIWTKKLLELLGLY